MRRRTTRPPPPATKATILLLVHKSADGKLAVVGVLIQEDTANAAFEPVWAKLPKSMGTIAR